MSDDTPVDAGALGTIPQPPAMPTPAPRPEPPSLPTVRPSEVPAPRPTVLFVDDEEEVLAGLRVSLRRHRNDYHLRFATSADDAVAILDRESVDMVVTDMRMPERSGADLLDELRFRFPDVIRYVLSGQADDRLIHRSVAVTHRWLSKPCPPEVLIATLAEATGHWSRLADSRLRQAVGAVDALPSHPEVYLALVELLDSERATPEQVAGLIALDPAVSLKVLQWANSAYVVGEPVYDVRRAVERIGVSSLRTLAKADEMIRPFTPSEVIPGFPIDLFHRYSRAVASLAASLAAPEDAHLAWTGGLLSNVGLLVEVSQLRDQLIDEYARAEADGRTLDQTDRRRGGVGLAELGGHLLALWGLPSGLTEVVVASDHLPELGADIPLDAVNAVRAARLLAQRLPLAQGVGAPHRVETDDRVNATLDRWTGDLNLASRFGVRR
ncbi:MAG: HDOD domain-containing protein [Actinomycetota bacterium]